MGDIARCKKRVLNPKRLKTLLPKLALARLLKILYNPNEIFDTINKLYGGPIEPVSPHSLGKQDAHI
jgi:hypothetical protein